jgi:2-polyprenyl-6-methoxyphenol hydroxylase-like FAD-dependent oxidoreductase
MTHPIYDIITVGGGLGGASFAKAMAEHGARVLVLERETRFKDRIRGEVIWSWGVAELRELGSLQLLSCSRERQRTGTKDLGKNNSVRFCGAGLWPALHHAGGTPAPP